MKDVKIFLLLVATILVSGCVGQTPAYKPAAPEVPEIEHEIPAAAPGAPAPSTKEFTVKASDFKFEPDNLAVNQGDTIKITVMNEQGYHNLFIEGYNQRTDMASAPDLQNLEFVADQSGTFDFWCEVSGHKALGMEGQLEVN